MATTTPRRALIVKIQKQLARLNISQLQTIYCSIDDDTTTGSIDETNEIDLYDAVVDYLRSDMLQSLEDEGLSHLLHLDDLITDLLQPTDSIPPRMEEQVHIQMEDQPTHPAPAPPSPSHPQPPPGTSPREIATSSLPQPQADSSPSSHPSTMTEGFPTRANEEIAALPPSFTYPLPTAKPVHPPLSEARSSFSSGKQVLSLSDVASLLPRREFKLHGGQISDIGSEVSFGNLCKQIDEGLQEGFTESEIIRSVLKMIKPGTFKEMLTNKTELTIDELKKFLRSHICDKNSTELFQELSNAKQLVNETPQQFLYRMMGLKQRVLFESQQGCTGFSYDAKLVQGTFLHTLYQGMNEKNDHVRRDLKPILHDMKVSDDFLLEQITKSTREETERQKRLGTTVKAKTVTVATLDSGEARKDRKVDKERQIEQDTIRELTAQVSSLTKHLAQLTKPSDQTVPVDSAPMMRNPQTSMETRGRCKSCAQQNKVTCQHCFVCGQAGHRAIGCLQKKRSGNGSWLLEKGNQ